MTTTLEEQIRESAARHTREGEPRRNALLPILHDIQSAQGHVNEDAIRLVAEALNLTRAEVHGVVSFYHDFRSEASRLPVLKLCRAEACKARGVEQLIGPAQAAAAGKVTIETVYCLGLCSVGPAALAGEKLHARLDAARLDALIGEMA